MDRIARIWVAAVLAAVAAVFVAAPASAVDQRTTVAVIGDFGAGTAQEAAVAALVRKSRPSAIITVGDNLYAPLNYANAVGRYYSPSSMYPATGNHDYSQGPIGAYRAYFPNLKGRTVYSVRRGPIEFFILDSQAALDSSTSMSGQQAWLQGKLKRSTASWKVVVLHHPPFSSGAVHGSTPEFQWPFATWGADLVLSGHDHDYERITRDGTTYVVAGMGGAKLYPFSSPVEGSALRVSDAFGALQLDASDTTLTGRFRSIDGSTKDAFTLTR